MKTLWSFLLLSLPLSSWAQQSPTCPDIVERRGSIQIQQTSSGDNSNCYLSVHNFKREGLIYRDYLFTADGEFMVFNSFGSGPDSEFTGAREFFMFPRPNKLVTFNWNDEARRLEVTDANGTLYFFDYEDAQVTAMSKAKVQVAPDVVAENKGGVEISNFKGILLDLGFTKGHAPSQESNGVALFKDEAGQSCKMKNSDIFKYTADGDVRLKYSDKNLATLLKSKCPKLKFPTSN